MFYLINWGFSYETLSSIPTYEFYDYIKLLNDHNAEKPKPGQTVENKEPRPVGSNWARSTGR